MCLLLTATRRNCWWSLQESSEVKKKHCASLSSKLFYDMLDKGWRMVPRKTWISENFWQDLEISEAFLRGLEVSFWHFFFFFTFFESRNFLPKSLGLRFLIRISASRRVSDFTIRHPFDRNADRPEPTQAWHRLLLLFQGTISSVVKALDARAEGRGLDPRGRNMTEERRYCVSPANGYTLRGLDDHVKCRPRLRSRRKLSVLN